MLGAQTMYIVQANFAKPTLELLFFVFLTKQPRKAGRMLQWL